MADIEILPTRGAVVEYWQIRKTNKWMARIRFRNQIYFISPQPVKKLKTIQRHMRQIVMIADRLIAGKDEYREINQPQKPDEYHKRNW